MLFHCLSRVPTSERHDVSPTPRCPRSETCRAADGAQAANRAARTPSANGACVSHYNQPHVFAATKKPASARPAFSAVAHCTSKSMKTLLDRCNWLEALSGQIEAPFTTDVRATIYVEHLHEPQRNWASANEINSGWRSSVYPNTSSSKERRRRPLARPPRLFRSTSSADALTCRQLILDRPLPATYRRDVNISLPHSRFSDESRTPSLFRRR